MDMFEYGFLGSCFAPMRRRRQREEQVRQLQRENRELERVKEEERRSMLVEQKKEKGLKGKRRPDQMPPFEEKMGDMKRYGRETSPITFVSSPAPSDEVIRCCLVRDVESDSHSTYFKMYQKMENDTKKLLITARTKKNMVVADYLLIVDAVGFLPSIPWLDRVVGKLTSNKMGNQFTLCSNGEKPTKSKKQSKTGEDLVESKAQEELTSICYKTDFWGRKGARKMSVTIPGVKDIENVPPQFTEDVIELRVTEAECNQNTLTLDFGGEVTQESRRNFQLIQADNPDYIVLQFGRVSQNEFMMDYRYPLSPLQALSICLSSVHSKLSCR